MSLIDCLTKHNIVEPVVQDHFLDLQNKYKKEGMGEREAAIRAVREMRDRTMDSLHDVYRQLGIKGYDVPKQKDLTPEQAKAALGTPVPSEEPPAKEGRTPVTISGLTEAERQGHIEQRRKETTITEKSKTTNDLLSKVSEYNGLKNGRLGKLKAEGIQALNDIRVKAADLGYSFDERSGRLRDEKGKTIRANYKDMGDKAVVDNGKPLRDRNSKTQDVFGQLLEAGEFPTGNRLDGRKMTAEELNGTIEDIINGLPSERAEKYLNDLEDHIERNRFPIADSGMGREGVTLHELLLMGKETHGEPLTEEGLRSWLTDQAEKTHQDEPSPYDNVDNLLYDYEGQTTNAGTLQQPNQEGEGKPAGANEPDQQNKESGKDDGKPEPAAEQPEAGSKIVGSGGEPPKAEATQVKEPEGTKIANAILDSRIQGHFGLKALNDVISKLQDTDVKAIWENVKTRIAKGLLDVKKVRERVMTEKKGSEMDQAALLYDRAELEGKEKDLIKSINEESDTEAKKALQKQLLDVQNSMMDNALANRAIGRSASTIFRIRQQWVAPDMNLADMMEQYKASKGVDHLTPEQEQKVKDAYNENKRLEAEKEKLRQDYEKAVAENKIIKAENDKLKELDQKAKTQKKADRAKKSSEVIAKSQERIEKAREDLKKLRGNLSAGADPRVALAIGKIAAEKFYQGIVKLDELVKNVLDEVKDIFPHWTAADVRQHLFPDFDKEQAFTYTSKDFEASNKEVQDKQQAYKEIQHEHALNMFKWQKDRMMDLMKDRSFKERAIAAILQWQRFAVLTYPSTIAKLVAVVVHQLTLKPIKFLMQKAVYEVTDLATKLPQLFGGKKGVNPLDKAGIWGDPKIRSLAAYYSALIKNFSLANLKEHFSGIDTKEILYGRGMYDEWVAAKGLLEMPGRSHGYIKSFVKNPEFQFAHEQLLAKGLQDMEEISEKLKDTNLTPDQRTALEEAYGKVDVTNLDNMEVINQLALQHGKWGILMNDNQFVDKFRAWADKKNIANALMRSELPILKIPVNFVSRAFAYKYGLIQAMLGKKMYDINSGKVIQTMPSVFKLIFKGTEGLTDSQAELLGKTLNLGSMGAAFFLLGYFNRKQVKMNDDGSVEMFGIHIPKLMLHSPEFESYFSGVRVASRKPGHENFAQALAESDIEIAKKSPFANWLTYGFLPRMAGIMVNKSKDEGKLKQIEDAVNLKITDMTVPGAVKEPAQWMDTKKGFSLQSEPIKRRPTGDYIERLWQSFEVNFPGVRKNVKRYFPKAKH